MDGYTIGSLVCPKCGGLEVLITTTTIQHWTPTKVTIDISTHPVSFSCVKCRAQWEGEETSEY